MTPYEILGVEASAPFDEIETAYKAMVRRFSAGLSSANADEKARAEQRIREVHAAMAQIRKDVRGSAPRQWVETDEDDVFVAPSSPVADSRDLDGATAGVRRFGRQDGSGSVMTPEQEVATILGDPEWVHGVQPLVPCPHCGAQFDEAEPFRDHLREAHGLSVKSGKVVRADLSVFETLGLARSLIALALLIGALVAVMLKQPVWVPLAAIGAVFLVLLSAVFTNRDENPYIRSGMKQHKAIRWF